MKKENIDFFVNKMKKEGFQAVRFKTTPENAQYVGFELFKDGAYIDTIVIDDGIKDDCLNYYYGKFIMACQIIARYRLPATEDPENETI